jgi:hypothetical protein
MPMSPTRAAIEGRRLAQETKAASASGNIPRLQRGLAAETYWIAKCFGVRQQNGSARQSQAPLPTSGTCKE